MFGDNSFRNKPGLHAYLGISLALPLLVWSLAGEDEPRIIPLLLSYPPAAYACAAYMVRKGYGVWWGLLPPLLGLNLIALLYLSNLPERPGTRCGGPSTVGTSDTLQVAKQRGGPDIVAFGFAGAVWVLVTLLGLLMARRAGWPAMLHDVHILLFAPISLAMVLLVVIKREELLKGCLVRCPACHAIIPPRKYDPLTLILGLCSGPFWLLFAGPGLTTCHSCGTMWRA